MKLWTALLTATITFSMAIPVNAETVYKWEDDDGIIQYTDAAPTDREYVVLEMHGGMPSGADKATEKLEQQRADKFQAAEQSGEYAQQQRERDDQAKVRKENCTNAQNNLKLIQENSRVRVLDDNGEFRYIDDNERQQHIDRAKTIISDNCDA